MTGARTNTLASLRGSIERIESHADATALDRVRLGHADADAAMQGGLAKGVVHEVFAEGRQSAAATGLITGLAGRVSACRPLVWVRQGTEAAMNRFNGGEDPQKKDAKKAKWGRFKQTVRKRWESKQGKKEK